MIREREFMEWGFNRRVWLVGLRDIENRSKLKIKCLLNLVMRRLLMVLKRVVWWSDGGRNNIGVVREWEELSERSEDECFIDRR